MKTTVAIIVLLFAGLSGCGGGGGSNGPACVINQPCVCAVGVPGPNASCPEGTLCTNIATRTECRVLCTSNADCPIDQNCEGVANTTLKSCQPIPTPAP